MVGSLNPFALSGLGSSQPIAPQAITETPAGPDRIVTATMDGVLSPTGATDPTRWRIEDSLSNILTPTVAVRGPTQLTVSVTTPNPAVRMEYLGPPPSITAAVKLPLEAFDLPIPFP